MSNTPTDPTPPVAEAPAAAAPAPLPAPAPAPTPAQMAIISPVMAMLKSRKGIVVLGAIAFCMVVYLRDPSKLDKILNFLTVAIPGWFLSQSWEDGKKHEANGNGATHNGG